jgi:cbb3-type cytochrome oxidase maturation protein
MMIVVLLIAISLSIALLFLGLFLWSIKSGQYRDTYTPSVRMLFENKQRDSSENNSNAVNTSRPSGT